MFMNCQKALGQNLDFKDVLMFVDVWENQGGAQLDDSEVPFYHSEIEQQLLTQVKRTVLKL